MTALESAFSIFKEWIDKEPDNYKYMLLDRMRSDCEYIINACHCSPTSFKFLWAHEDPVAHICFMKYMWNQFAEKPEWLTMEQIEEYERKLCPKKVV